MTPNPLTVTAGSLWRGTLHRHTQTPLQFIFSERIMFEHHYLDGGLEVTGSSYTDASKVKTLNHRTRTAQHLFRYKFSSTRARVVLLSDRLHDPNTFTTTLNPLILESCHLPAFNTRVSGGLLSPIKIYKAHLDVYSVVRCE